MTTPTTNALAPTMREWLANPLLLQVPKPLIPYFAWPERITLYSSPDKGGKSTLLSAAAAAFSRGELFLTGGPREPGRVLWVCLEEHQADLLRRLQRFGANPDNIRILAFPMDVRDAVKVVVADYRPELVVIDTLIRYAKGWVKRGGDSQQWAELLADFIEFSRVHKSAVILAHHARRSDGEARDSGDIPSVCDAVLEQKSRQEAGRQQFAVRGRWAMDDFAVRLENDTYVLVPVKLTAKQRVLQYIRQHPGCATRELKGGRTATIADLLKELEVEGAICNDGTAESAEWRLVEDL